MRKWTRRSVLGSLAGLPLLGKLFANPGLNEAEVIAASLEDNPVIIPSAELEPDESGNCSFHYWDEQAKCVRTIRSRDILSIRFEGHIKSSPWLIINTADGSLHYLDGALGQAFEHWWCPPSVGMIQWRG